MLIPPPLLFVVYGIRAPEALLHRVLYRSVGTTRVRKKTRTHSSGATRSARMPLPCDCALAPQPTLGPHFDPLHTEVKRDRACGKRSLGGSSMRR